MISVQKKNKDFVGGLVANILYTPGDPGSIPGQGIQIPHVATKDLKATTKTGHSQIN